MREGIPARSARRTSGRRRLRAPARACRIGGLVELLVILVLVAVNGLFAGAEIAVVSLRKTRLRELLASGGRRAKAVDRLRRDPERFLATVQIGITVIGAAAGAFGGSTWAAHIAAWLRDVPVLGPHADRVALVLVVAAISYLSLVLGELVPKSLALRASERFALLVAPPILMLSRIARPLVWLLTASSNLVLRLFGDRTNFIESKLSSDELRQLVQEASAAGSVDVLAGDIASRAIEFGDLTVADVRIHRRAVVALELHATDAQVRAAFVGAGHRRVPVYEGTIDKVVGYVSWQDVLPKVWDRQPVALEGVLREPHFVFETMRAADLLKDMLARRSHLAIALDEHGGMDGIVTLEDLLEELVGEIFSEHDKAGIEPIQKRPDGWLRVHGSVPLRELNRALGVELDDNEEATTIAGLCLQLNRNQVPPVGTKLRTPSGLAIEVLEASPRRVLAVQVRRAGA